MSASDNIITEIFAITLMEYQEFDRLRGQRDRRSISLRHPPDQIDRNDIVDVESGKGMEGN